LIPVPIAVAPILTSRNKFAFSVKRATSRLLDPPLHEFLPHEKSAQAELAKTLNIK